MVALGAPLPPRGRLCAVGGDPDPLPVSLAQDTHRLRRPGVRGAGGQVQGMCIVLRHPGGAEVDPRREAAGKGVTLPGELLELSEALLEEAMEDLGLLRAGAQELPDIVVPARRRALEPGRGLPRVARHALPERALPRQLEHRPRVAEL